MAGSPITIRGERFVLLEDIAESYHVEVQWLEEAYVLGLFGSGETVESSHAIPVTRLGLVARVLRWRLLTGIDAIGIVALIDPEE